MRWSFSYHRYHHENKLDTALPIPLATLATPEATALTVFLTTETAVLTIALPAE